MKVSFIIAGTQKGGTTALAKFLSEHPRICIPEKKELKYFDRDEYFFGSYPDYDKYHRHFKYAKNKTIWGEATPIYMYWHRAARRIKKYNPNIKLILILRNPIERAYSHYMMEKKRNFESWPFSRAIRLEKLRCISKFPRQHRVFSYVDRGFYSKQINKLFKYFSPSQILFLKTEDLKYEHRATIDRVCEFLCIDKLESTVGELIFSNKYKPMNAADKTFLRRKYTKEIERLELLLNWDCSNWKNF